MNNPLISVIIPCYNASKYVEKAVRSIMEQTYTNLEIIITDDYSTDTTLSILEKLACEDKRIKIIKNTENLKIVKTLNKMLDIANGKYIARMDADDLSLPERIAKQVAFLESNPDYVMCGTNAWHINENGKKIGKSTLPLTYEDNRFFLSYYSTFYHPTVMIKSEVYKNNKYDEKFIYAEDYELWCRIVFKEKLKVYNLNEKLFKYRILKAQSSNIHSSEQVKCSASIFDKYNVDGLNATMHKNIYFLHDQNIENELAYVKQQLKLLSKKQFQYSYECFHKLFFHIFRRYSKKDLFLLLCNSNGARTIIKLFLTKRG